MDKETAKVWFWILLDVFIAVAAFNLFFFVMPALDAFKNSFLSARTITVSAQGMTTASPDMAKISFSVLTQGTDPKTLSDDNNRKMNAVLRFVASQGIAPEDAATTDYNLIPNYQWDKYYNRSTIIGYTLTQTVQVKVRDLAKVPSVLSGLAPLGVNQIGNIQFGFQDPNKFVAIARADALRKAEKQAADMASQAGTGLRAIVTIGETPVIPVPYPRAYAAQNFGAMGAMKDAPVVPSIEPGTQDVTDTVTITYALR